jgi:hypothetical protein
MIPDDCHQHEKQAIIFLINSRDSIKPDLLIRTGMIGVLPWLNVQVKQKPINDVKEEEPFHQEAPGLKYKQKALKDTVASSSCIDSAVHTGPSMEPLLSVIQRHQVLQRTTFPCTKITYRLRDRRQ